MPNKIQPREYSTGSGKEGISCNSDGDPNPLNANRNDDGQWLNTTYDRPDDRWNSDNGFAFARPKISSFFLSLFFTGRVFLCNKTSRPTAQVSADPIQLFRKQDIFSII
jgi:hypothetical protein